MAQQWIVGIIVALACLYALWYWMPASLRRHLKRVDPSLAKAPGCGACSSCDSCGTASTSREPVPGGGTEGAAPGSSPMVRKPIWLRPGA